MNDVNLATVCGLYCGNCEYFERQCNGCGYVAGKPFWTAQITSRICPLYDCCHNCKQLDHCGECAEFPCKTFGELRDPQLSDEEFQKSLEDRQKLLNRRNEIGTKAWLQEMSCD